MIRKLTAAEVDFTLEATFEDDVPVEGNALASGDDDADRECEREILERLERGDVWAWCCVVVRACWKGHAGLASLGACCYADEADFKAEGGYYAQLCTEALEDLNAGLAADAQVIEELRVP